MKFIVLFIISMGCFSAQTKLNTKSEVDILFDGNTFSLHKIFDGNEPYMFKIVNNTNNTYIIDPYGFKSNNFVMTCEGNLIEPEKVILGGFYKRSNDQECFDDLIILNPYEQKYLPLSITNLDGSYDLKDNKKYILRLKSIHNNYTATLLGCQVYIKTLITSKGYKIFDDTINARILLIP